MQHNKIRFNIFEKYKLFLLPALAAILSIYLLKDYFLPGIQIILGIMVAPFVFKVQKNSYSNRYAILSVMFMLLFYFLQVHILLYFSLGCLILYTIESNIGRVGVLPFLFLLCVSPALHYLINVSTFSIRLELSRYSALILNSVGLAVTNKGSYFIMPNGNTFSVDTACIGLNMFNTGLALTLLLIGFSEQKTNKKNNFLFLILIFVSTLSLLILTNLLRIVALVLFESPPQTLQHDLIGIASLIVYTVLPLYFLINFLNKKYGKLILVETVSTYPNLKINYIITFILSISILITGIRVITHLKQTIKDVKLNALQLQGFSKTIAQDGVAEFIKESILIYIKPACKGYESDHPPSICWQGSGFKIEEIAEVTVSGHVILNAILKKDKTIQYTAWWYDNGSDKTISQWKWRFAIQEPYRIINITTANKVELDSLCKEYLALKLF